MATYLGSPDDLDPITRKQLESEIGELPERLQLKVRTYFTCYLCNKREYLDEYNRMKGEQPTQIIINRKRYRVCKLYTTMILMVKEKR